MQLINQSPSTPEVPTTKAWKNIAIALTQASALLLAPNAFASSTDVNVDTNANSNLLNSNALDSTPYSDTAYSSEPNPWKIDLAILGYKESDGRVTAFEPVVNANKDFGDERILNVKLVLDTLTGASPYGAAPANTVQVFTSPSGGSQAGSNTTTGPSGGSGSAQLYGEDEDNNEDGATSGKVIPAGELPLDSSFKDTRVAANVGWSQPLTERIKGSIAGNVSSEYDFKSLGLNATLSKDFNDKNTTLTGGLSLEYDLINPVGGAPVANSVSYYQQKDGNQTKTVVEGMIGLTQLLTPRSLIQLNYAVASSQGYMNDPYKLVTVLDTSNNLIPVGSSANSYTYLYESRPDTRLRHAIYGQYKYHFDNSIADASYRLTTDDWGVTSHTVDGKWRFNLLDNHYFIEPHIRAYQQSAADFYHGYLKVGDTASTSGDGYYTPVGGFASADSRLAGFAATTMGLKVGKIFSTDNELSMRIEQYKQTADSAPAITSGDLAGLTIQPDLSAILLQISYGFKW